MSGWIDSEDSRLLVLLLRAIRRWSQEELARVAEMDQGQISDYEQGVTVPRRESLERLCAAASVPYSLVLYAVLPALRLLRFAVADRPGAYRQPADAAAAGARIATAGTDVTAPVLAECLRELPADEDASRLAGGPSPADRELAKKLWERLKPLPARSRRLLVRFGEEFNNWALVELLCAESAAAAPAGARPALELAELALAVTARVAGAAPWLSRLQAYCQAFLGNSRRVSGDLDAAERSFAEARRLWQASTGAPDLLEASRMLDLEASLRRDQRRFTEALALHKEALIHSSGLRAAHFLLNKSATLEQMGDAEGAIAALREALPHVDAEINPPQAFALYFNLAASLCDLGFAAEAEPLLPALQELVAQWPIDSPHHLRLRWLRGKTAAGLSQREEAATLLFEVRERFVAQDMAYDAALATLDLAGVLAEAGRTAEVKTLARESQPIFQALRIGREAVAAGQLFAAAAERESLTAALARQLAERLKLAANKP